MKLLFSIFTIFMLSNGSIKVVTADADYHTLATYIQNNITTLVYYLSQVDDKVQLTHQRLNQTAQTINFGLSENPQIIELKDSLKQHQFNKDIVKCISLFNKDAQNVVDNLRSTFINLVDAQLNTNKIGLFNTRQELVNISISLQGPSLEQEIKTCNDNASACKITIDYPNTVDKDDKYVHAVENITNTLLDTIFTTAIKPSIPEKVNEMLYVPVTGCIKTLVEDTL